MYTLLCPLPLQQSDTGAASPQAAALETYETGSVASFAELISGMPPLPTAAPGPHALVANWGDGLFAGAAPGTLLKAPPAITIEDDTTEGGQ